MVIKCTNARQTRTVTRAWTAGELNSGERRQSAQPAGLDHLDRRIAALALPALGAIAAEPLYNLADTAIVGHLGRLPLDALAIAATALSLASWLAIFLTTATTSAISRLSAAGDRPGAGRTAGAAYLAAAVLGVLAAAVLAGAAPLLAWLLGARGAVAAGATSYLRISACGLPFLYLGYAGNGHMTGLANVRTGLQVAVAANAANIALECGLVFWAHWGLAGSAWGTVIAQAGAAGLYAMASRRGGAARRAGVRPSRPGRAEVTGLLRDGHRLSVRTIALGLVPMAVTAIAARLGPVDLGGQQIAMRVWYLLSLSLDSLAVPGQVYVSMCLGRGDTDAAYRTGQRTLRFGLLAGAALGVITFGLAFVAPGWFTTDPEIAHAAATALAVAALTQPLAALAFVLDGLILGLEDYAAMRRAMIIAALAFAPAGALVAGLHWPGLPGVWAAVGIWLAARSVLLRHRWRAAPR
jgi:putative MATE family efflux protein